MLWNIFKYFITCIKQFQVEKHECRRIQLWFAVFYFLRNISFIIYVYYQYFGLKQAGNREILWENLGMELNILSFCGFLVVSGVISYLLTIKQIFLKTNLWYDSKASRTAPGLLAQCLQGRTTCRSKLLKSTDMIPMEALNTSMSNPNCNFCKLKEIFWGPLL